MKELQQEWVEEFERRAWRHIRIFRVMADAVNDLAMHEMECYISGLEIEHHDQSKFSDIELPAYSRQFCGPADDPEGWKGALQHHYAANPHHPQHWSIFRHSPTMRKAWVMAMVADWLAASYQYTGSLDMQDWLDEHMGASVWTPMTLETERRVTRVLRCLGYVPNWDNAPLWGWVGRDWVPDVMGKLEEQGLD